MIRITYSNITRDLIGANGLTEDDLLAIDSAKIQDMFLKKSYPELAFLDLPKQDISEIKKIGEYARQFENFIVLGIGGSALGPRSIVEALSPFHNYLRKPRVFIYDNVDPLTLKKILEIIDLDKSLINVISKSGSTAETAASFMVLWQRLKDLGLSPQRHMVITTDPERGNLRKIVRDFHLRSLSIHPNVVGRYSVLSPVGLLTAEVVGIDCRDMLEGASEIGKKCLNFEVMENPALLFASALYQFNVLKKLNITVMLPYSDRLKAFSEWFCQLWAESLGKDGKGLIPYPSVGTTDQHSQLQAWMEGPKSFVVVFIAIEDYGVDIEIPVVFNEIEGLSYLSNHSLAELIKIEQEATEIALSKSGKPCITIQMPKIDAYHLGQLFHLFSIATAMAGFLFGVNPFNQPGVEEGKDLTYGMMGKRGYEKKIEEFLSYRKNKNRFVI
ncbi:MAG: glucose-6-phosphate isomerase [Thermodesulfovibrionales bacterium]|nr:glucose-6-phosphate isomerase [Thermodesulfovibrionales bacterium]